MAQISAFVLIGYRVIVRRISESNRDKKIDFSPCLMLSSCVQCLVAVIAGAKVASPDYKSFLWLFLGGGLEVPLTNAVLYHVASVVPLGEIEVYTSFALMLQPFWVWLCSISTPDSVSLILGVVLFSAILFNNVATTFDGEVNSKPRYYEEDNFRTYNNGVVGGNRLGGYVDDEGASEGGKLFIRTPERAFTGRNFASRW